MLTMPHSLSSATRIITIVSLVAISALSFTVLYGTLDVVDTLPQDSLFSFNRRDLPRHPRVFHHARAVVEPVVDPILLPPPVSLSSAGPSQSLSSPPANTQSPIPQPVSPLGPAPSSSTPSPPPPAPSASASAPAPAPAPAPASASPTSSFSSPLPTPSPTSSVIPAAISSAPLLRSSSSSSLSSTTAPSLRAPTKPTTSATLAASHVAFVPPTTTSNQGASNTFTGFLIPSTGSTSTISASPTAAAIAKGFFANKVAVGVTFSIVGIVCGLAAMVALVTVTKRYRESRRVADDDEFFEKYLGAGTGGHGDNLPEEHTEVGQGPFGVSATDLNTFPAPPDAYPDRAIHFGQSNPGSVLRPGNYGIEYPPELANATSTSANHSSNVQRGYAYNETRSPSGPSASHPFADPANLPPIGAAPVTYPRPVFGRAQEMVATDSYYGPNSAGVGAGGMGIAH